jgi:hypothetical protein
LFHQFTIEEKVMKFIKNLAVAIATICSMVSVTTAFAQNISVQKFPIQFTLHGINFNGLEGHYIHIDDYKILKFANPNMQLTNVFCKNIHPSTVDYGGVSKRANCLNSGVKYTCSGLYNNTNIYPGYTDIQRMVPNMPIQTWVAKKKQHHPEKDFFAINLGFFNTRPLPGRPTNQNQWKPIYQESCGRGLGTYKREYAFNDQWYSSYNNREIKSDGSQDKPFGTVIFKKESNNEYETYLSHSANADHQIALGDFAFSGVFVQWDNTRYTKTTHHIPDFVEDKWDALVGRTAVGFNQDTKEMGLVVIQPGRNGVGEGFSVDDVLDLFQHFPHVMLLDGSGSSQFASSKEEDNLDDGNQYTPGRTSCIHGAIDACSIQGDSVENSFVSHKAAKYLTPDPQNSGKSLIDRPNPTIMLIEY